MTAIFPRYSGPDSKDVWARVHGIQDEKMCALVYLAACSLQDHETRFLQILQTADPSARVPNGER